MRSLAVFLLASTMIAGPAIAQTPYEPPPADNPSGSLESDLDGALDGIMGKLLEQVQPHLDRLGRDLNDTVTSFSPVLNELGTLMDDVGNYQAPERLENGDILIRRRADAPPPPPIGKALRDLMAPDQTLPETAPEPAPSHPFSLPDPARPGEIEL